MVVTATSRSLFVFNIRFYLSNRPTGQCSSTLQLIKPCLGRWLFCACYLRAAIFIRSIAMFEHRQDQMDHLMKENDNFRRLYNRHQALDKQVTEAEMGRAPLDDLALNKLKKEKLLAKDKLAHLMDALPA